MDLKLLTKRIETLIKSLGSEQGSWIGFIFAGINFIKTMIASWTKPVQVYSFMKFVPETDFSLFDKIMTFSF